ncbi:putative 26S proteasome non-ATPase regulatory subunit 3 [Monocercomonoides exilis]|uniref:putative 26S proteasome non-ATPase regulatory subunit 3 n=1 Tax=Monocercomonoides exilis TaxID=2049356 RepID=UPI0035597931|nr:putative 26S proteasome non-ATPase regulatory subunit 3 [Monocercomonoides exilis]|eukprot:MONOS_925.1-p1 / transcript=MONOS_925.1 / gene=MONOS_925 / organism=Monocercomonoides_exilis_PA203 / gene_product=LOC779536 protein / transcript_product=LOC779536 protein / location=Mono_scaffold00015:155103-157852(-) / protein_length=447 / sequence_SO=supercontig / SO=protein_coding / is_pseudo=false
MKTEEEKPLLNRAERKGAPAAYRWVTLLFTSLLAFGGYFVYDMLPTMQVELSAALDINAVQYNIFYTVYSLTNCVCCLFGGPLVDRTTNRLGAILFQSLVVIGQGVLSLGAHFRQYWLMILGRVFLGMGLGNTTVVKNSILNMFFTGKELALAFGITITFARIGSVMNFFISPTMVASFGFEIALWIGFGTCVFSLVCAFVYTGLEIFAEKKKWVRTGKNKKNKFKLKDITKFPLSFWMMSCVCGLYHANIYAMYAVMVDLIETLFNYSTFMSGVLASVIYMVSIPGSIIVGFLVDKIGKRCYLSMLACIFAVAFDLVSCWTNWNPIPWLVVAGLSYSIVASVVWTSVSVLVDLNAQGTGNSIMTCIQMVFVATANLLVGVITNSMGYKPTIAFLFICSCVALLFLFGVKVYEVKKNNDRLDWFTPSKQAKVDASKNIRREDSFYIQ